jgi:hypothetical protein
MTYQSWMAKNKPKASKQHFVQLLSVLQNFISLLETLPVQCFTLVEISAGNEEKNLAAYLFDSLLIDRDTLQIHLIPTPIHEGVSPYTDFDKLKLVWYMGRELFFIRETFDVDVSIQQQWDAASPLLKQIFVLCCWLHQPLKDPNTNTKKRKKTPLTKQNSLDLNSLNIVIHEILGWVKNFPLPELKWVRSDPKRLTTFESSKRFECDLSDEFTFLRGLHSILATDTENYTEHLSPRLRSTIEEPSSSSADELFKCKPVCILLSFDQNKGLVTEFILNSKNDFELLSKHCNGLLYYTQRSKVLNFIDSLKESIADLAKTLCEGKVVFPKGYLVDHVFMLSNERTTKWAIHLYTKNTTGDMKSSIFEELLNVAYEPITLPEYRSWVLGQEMEGTEEKLRVANLKEFTIFILMLYDRFFRQPFPKAPDVQNTSFVKCLQEYTINVSMNRARPMWLGEWTRDPHLDMLVSALWSGEVKEWKQMLHSDVFAMWYSNVYDWKDLYLSLLQDNSYSHSLSQENECFREMFEEMDERISRSPLPEIVLDSRWGMQMSDKTASLKVNQEAAWKILEAFHKSFVQIQHFIPFKQSFFIFRKQIVVSFKSLLDETDIGAGSGLVQEGLSLFYQACELLGVFYDEPRFADHQFGGRDIKQQVINARKNTSYWIAFVHIMLYSFVNLYRGNVRYEAWFFALLTGSKLPHDYRSINYNVWKELVSLIDKPQEYIEDLCLTFDEFLDYRMSGDVTKEWIALYVESCIQRMLHDRLPSKIIKAIQQAFTIYVPETKYSWASLYYYFNDKTPLTTEVLYEMIEVNNLMPMNNPPADRNIRNLPNSLFEAIHSHSESCLYGAKVLMNDRLYIRVCPILTKFNEDKGDNGVPCVCPFSLLATFLEQNPEYVQKLVRFVTGTDQLNPDIDANILITIDYRHIDTPDDVISLPSAQTCSSTLTITHPLNIYNINWFLNDQIEDFISYSLGPVQTILTSFFDAMNSGVLEVEYNSDEDSGVSLPMMESEVEDEYDEDFDSDMEYLDDDYYNSPATGTVELKDRHKTVLQILYNQFKSRFITALDNTVTFDIR